MENNKKSYLHTEATNDLALTVLTAFYMSKRK